MYGRNELIARYIKMTTGKSRSRKQVSSHIQVLARRKSKEIQSHARDPLTKEKVLQSLSSMSSSQIISANPVYQKGNPPNPHHTPTSNLLTPPLPPGTTIVSPEQFLAYQQQQQQLHMWNISPNVTLAEIKVQPIFNQLSTPPTSISTNILPPTILPYTFDQKTPPKPAYSGRSICGPKLRLVEFSAYQEQPETETPAHRHVFVHINSITTYTEPFLESVDICQIADKFPNKKGGLKELFDQGPQSAFFLVKFWADLSTNISPSSGFYGISSLYESDAEMVVQCSTKVCSFGKQVVEKVETEYGQESEGGRFTYNIHRSPMCEYLVNFIHKLKTLPQKFMMNSVLENFTILQVIVHRETQETLLCIAYVFEVSTSQHGAQHHIYRLVKDSQ